MSESCRPTVPASRVGLPAIGGGLVLLGCADMLGLGGLSYDRGDETSVPFEPSVDPGDPPPLGSGGSTGMSLDDDDDFILDVAKASIFFSHPPDGRYWIYNPDESALASGLAEDGADGLHERSLESEVPRSHFAAFPHERGYLLLGYDDAKGTVHLSIDSGDDLLLVDEEGGTPGRTNLVAFPWLDRWLAFVSTESSGHYRYFDPDPDAGLDVVMGTLPPGFTSVAPFEFEEGEGVLAFNPESAEVRFDRLVQYGEALENVFIHALDVAASHLVTFRDSDGEWTALLYDDVTGKVGTGRFSRTDDSVEMFPIDDSLFPEGLTSITPVAVRGDPYAITFSRVTGTAQLRPLSPLEGGPIVVK